MEMKGIKSETVFDGIVTIDGKQFLKSHFTIDYGKYGVTKVESLDPNITPESQEKRRKAIKKLCEDQIRRGLT
jgi:hypothetical protein